MRRAKGPRRWGGRGLRRRAECAGRASKPACTPQAAGPSGATPMIQQRPPMPQPQDVRYGRLGRTHDSSNEGTPCLLHVKMNQ